MDKKSVIISLIPQRFRLNTSYDLCCHKIMLRYMAQTQIEGNTRHLTNGDT